MNSSPRGRGTDKVQPSPELAHLKMSELRDYRSHLRQEEERVSYWLRLVQTRLDSLSGAQAVDTLDADGLRRALGPTGTGERRVFLLATHAQTALPPLPELLGAWASAADSRDPAHLAHATAALQEASTELADYRDAVRDRLAAATSELITRYIADPHAAFDLIPRPASS